MAQKFLNFMQFFGKFGKIICWHPPGGLAPPPTGNPGSAPALDTIGFKACHIMYLNSQKNESAINETWVKCQETILRNV